MRKGGGGPATQAPPDPSPDAPQLRKEINLVRAPGTKLPKGPGLPPSSGAVPLPLLTGRAAGEAGRPPALRGAAAPEPGPGPPRAPPPSPPEGRASCPRPRAGSLLRFPAHRRPRRALGAAASTCAMARGRAGRSRRCPRRARRAPGRRRCGRSGFPPGRRPRRETLRAQPRSQRPARLCHAPGPDPRPGPAHRPDPAPGPSQAAASSPVPSTPRVLDPSLGARLPLRLQIHLTLATE